MCKARLSSILALIEGKPFNSHNIEVCNLYNELTPSRQAADVAEMCSADCCAQDGPPDTIVQTCSDIYP